MASTYTIYGLIVGFDIAPNVNLRHWACYLSMSNSTVVSLQHRRIMFIIADRNAGKFSPTGARAQHKTAVRPSVLDEAASDLLPQRQQKQL